MSTPAHSETTAPKTPSALIPPAATAGLATVLELGGLAYREALPSHPLATGVALVGAFAILFAVSLVLDAVRALLARGPIAAMGRSLATSRLGWPLFALLMLGGLAAWTADLALYVRLYPGYHAALGVAALGAWGLSIHLAMARQGPPDAVRWPVLGLALAVTLAGGHLVLQAREDGKAAVLGQGVIAADGAWMAARISDLDGDGVGWLYSAADPAPLDGAVAYAHACLGADSDPPPITWTPSRPAQPLDLLLITVDALRWDHTPSGGGDRFMPSVTRLAQQGTVFTAAYAPAAMTLPTVAALHTGRYPWALAWAPTVVDEKEQVRATGGGQPWPRAWPGDPRVGTPLLDRHPTLAEGLTAAGWTTIGWPPHETLLAPFGLGRGFATYRPDVVARGNPNGVSVTGHLVAGQAVQFIQRHAAEQPDAPFFAWVHLFDPHHPYRYPPGTATSDDSDLARYRAEVLYTDLQIGLVLRALDQSGRADRAVVVLTSDHGEAFGERGTAYHSTGLYDELIRVPLIVRGPGIARRSVPVPVSLVDVAPTVGGLLGLEPPGTWQGVDRSALLRGGGTAKAPVLAEVAYEDIHRQYALVDDGWKLVWDWDRGFRQLFDLAGDPGEVDNVIAAHPARAAALTDALCAGLKATEGLAARPAEPGRPVPLMSGPTADR